VLSKADQLHEPGATGALLRSEGLYNSHLTMGERERNAAALGALDGRREPF
jgi:hypothetical protein